MILMSMSAYTLESGASSTVPPERERLSLYRAISAPAVTNVTPYLSSVTWDEGVGAAYLKLRHGKVSGTLEVEAQVLVDVDAEGKALGIELLLSDRDAIKAIAKGLASETPL